MEKIKIKSREKLSNNHYLLEQVIFDFVNSDGKTQEQKREVYYPKNGAAALLYNIDKQTVILTKQLRIATYFNGNADGLMIEACAGIVEKNESPETSIIREIKEETGYEVKEVEKVLEMYPTPGAVAEKLFLYVAPYTSANKQNEGGGLDEEQEDIEVMEMKFVDAYNMIGTAEIKDAKTIMLLQYAKINFFK
jgi:GDP-mannose pyrophosphatase NudK